MRQPLTLLLVVSAVAVGAWQLYGDPPVQATLDPLPPVMHRKLEYSKTLLEGLATEDYEKISRNAQSLNLLSLESTWNVLVTEEYLKQSDAFRRALESIRDGAKEKNIDRAALGYVDMTIRCVECHKYVRRNKANIAERALGQ